MLNPVPQILRQSIRPPNSKLNIISFSTHERYDTCLSLTRHNFYYLNDIIDPNTKAILVKPWRREFAPIPPNIHILNGFQLPLHIDFDLILSQSKYSHIQIAQQLAHMLHIPIVSLEHCAPNNPDFIKYTQQFRAHTNVFISEFSQNAWQFPNYQDTYVIYHCIDSDLFRPLNLERKNIVLSVCNDFINRDCFLNFRGWQRITQGLPTKVVGDTPGLSKAASSVDELIKEYNSAKVFLNTSTVSPVPMSLLESMACSCCPVSTATCSIPEFIEHGVSGFLSNDENELKSYCQLLLKDENLAKNMGMKARERILEVCSKERFISQWNSIFEMTANKKYI